MTWSRSVAVVALCPLVFSVVLSCRSKSQQTSNPPIRVAAAADLTVAFEELGRAFEQETGERKRT